MPSASDLALVAKWQDKLLTDTCILMRATGSVDSYGQSIKAWGTVGVYPCRLASTLGLSLGMSARLLASAPITVESWIITLPGTVEVLAGDRVVSGGHTFECIGAGNEATWVTATRATAVRVE